MNGTERDAVSDVALFERVATALAARRHRYGADEIFVVLARAFEIAAFQTMFARTHASGSAEMPPPDGRSPRGRWKRFSAPQETASIVDRACEGGRRMVAIGTTVVRALESAVVDGEVVARRGRTAHLVSTALPPRVVDGLLPGFHEPCASHLLMLRAFLTSCRLETAYDAALDQGYLWHEFGDVHLILRIDSSDVTPRS